ncbi:hypothetical protein BO86DRAFT_396296 [Aspergillus japonicus CBS 114.51]|uniref:Uncharacterized protein n=2 Tax=Aspergillus TaxID=5052 RepID=A0A2V5H141_ASPV1|nr:hypothetical protein BO86DRAFT_396296 [Aspergillus japonicus CBS 114.51]PYI15472.1 hypothetical protein BO99DRAFT_405807 [Aspergillus violaceofuscus CBS 115571]RAH85288.1 hypothetical protein BO86DRAFT_396296 [Aspergillus japonicus CBS 114.51]
MTKPHPTITEQLQTTYDALLRILYTHTDAQGISHRPYGLDWIDFERLMYRLLLLQGLARPGDRIAHDPWVLFLDRYAPRSVRRSPSEAGRVEVAFFPSSILQSPSSGSPPRLVSVGVVQRGGDGGRRSVNGTTNGYTTSRNDSNNYAPMNSDSTGTRARVDSNGHVHFDHTAVQRDPSQRRSPSIPRYFQ